ncbi:MAG: hypothetical protein AAF456_16010 [Planctomycetota bacterium]
MIERVTNNNQRRNQLAAARRKGIAPSSSLRPHFVSLARQVRRWADSKSLTSANVGVTSLAGKAGRSTISFNLASAMTSIVTERVLLVESDFGKNFITRRLGLDRKPGLAEMMLGFEETGELIHEMPLNGLSILGCGDVSGQEALELPFDMLSNVMAERLSGFGYVVFDLPVATNLTACHAIASQLDGIILAVESNQIDQRQITRFRKQMEQCGVEIIGIVINKS